MRIVLIVLLALSIASCSEPTIDGSSQEKAKKSIEEVRNSLPEDKEEKFNEALKTVVMNEINLKDLLASGASGITSNLTSSILSKLDGKTGYEIISMADSIEKAKKRKQRRQALKKIEELRAKREKANEHRKKLQNFKILRSKFYKREERIGNDQPVIELTIQNNLDTAISRAYFEGIIASPDREVPWLKKEFNYKIAGGVEPGEKQTWTLGPNPYSDWGRVEVPPDAMLTVKVIRLDGPKGNELYDIEPLTEYEKERLKELKKKHLN